MNIRWYMALYDKTGWGFFKALGLDETYYKAEKAGVFALSHFIRYYSEADKFTAKLAVDQALDWEAPLSGAIHL